MNQKTNTIIILILIIAILSFIVLGSKKQSDSNSLVQDDNSTKTSENEFKNTSNFEKLTDEVEILYWGTTCPHCHDTIEWIENNNIEEKLNIVKKEVYENQQNAQELTQKAKICNMDTNSVGVPFMYTSDDQCLIGTPEITGYLENKVENLQSEEINNDVLESSPTGERD